MKLDLDVVAKEKRRVRGPIVTGCSPQWNFYPPIKFRRSFFVWLRSTSERGAGEKQDAHAVEEEVNFSTDRDRVISCLHVAYPIVVDQ